MVTPTIMITFSSNLAKKTKIYLEILSKIYINKCNSNRKKLKIRKLKYLNQLQNKLREKRCQLMNKSKLNLIKYISPLCMN